MRMQALAALLAVALAAAAPAAAEQPPPSDRIVLTVTEEAWVETDTARVVVQINSLLTDATAQEAAANPTAILDKVALGHWYITGSHRQQTDTGFERLLIVAEARLGQDALSGLYDKAKAASEKGREVRVLAVDFSPSLAEREATAAKLRQAVYAKAAAEAKAVAELFPSQGFRVHEVNFQGGGPVAAVPRNVRSKAMAMSTEAMEDAGGSPGDQVSERMILSATVVIAAPGQ